jgi:hypothetical protein
MPDEKPSDALERFLSEQKSMEDRKQGLIDDLLRQREAAMKDFDEKLAKLGYHGNSGKRKRSHHKQATESSAGTTAKPKVKA